ncbi:MAG: hypothetical protein DHS20C03_18960 [Minwuia thermotolerans]|nr:MAG: hypothetical protein DHS20C03_18960 [Minwuia thermotolerans]
MNQCIQRSVWFCIFCSIIFLTVGGHAHAKFPDRFDLQILNSQSVVYGEEFGLEIGSELGLSVVRTSPEVDEYIFSAEAGVVAGSNLPTTAVAAVDRFSFGFTRNPTTQIIDSRDLDARVVDQINSIFESPQKENFEKSWSQRVPIFSPKYIDFPGENPIVNFDVQQLVLKDGSVTVATYRSDEFEFYTNSGAVIRAEFVGYDIGTDNWRVPLASGFALIGTLEVSPEEIKPIIIRKRNLSLNPMTSRPHVEVRKIVPTDLLNLIEGSASYRSYIVSEEELPAWLSDLQVAALHVEAISSAIAEGRSNPLPLLAIAGVALAVDGFGTLVFNLSVDLTDVALGNKKLGDVNPFSDEGLKTKGIAGNLTYGAGKGVEGAAVAFGMDPRNAEALGLGTEAALDLSLVFFPTGAVGKAGNIKKSANVLWGTAAHRSGKAQKALNQMGKLAHQLGNTANRMSKSDKFTSYVVGVSGSAQKFDAALQSGVNIGKATEVLLNGAGQSVRDIQGPNLLDVSRSLVATGNREAQQLGYRIFAQVQANNFVTGAFINSGFSLASSSSGGFVDAAITGPLRFNLFDSGNLEDGDIVSLEVRSLNGQNIAPTNVTLTFAGRIFAPSVAIGPVEIRLVSVSEGAAPPTTGGLQILSSVTTGPSAQSFNLSLGQSGILRITAGL